MGGAFEQAAIGTDDRMNRPPIRGERGSRDGIRVFRVPATYHWKDIR